MQAKSNNGQKISPQVNVLVLMLSHNPMNYIK